jgi:hypothetical protein
VKNLSVLKNSFKKKKIEDLNRSVPVSISRRKPCVE